MWSVFQRPTKNLGLDAPKGHQMSGSAAKYPIFQFLLRLLEETGLDRSEFVLSLGYRNLDRGRRRLDAWIDQGKDTTGFSNKSR